MKTKVAEKDVQRACLDLLAAERIFAIRLNTVAMRNAKGRPIHAHSGGAGVADIIAFPNRTISFNPGDPCADFTYVTPLWIECKSSTGKQSDEQIGFQARVEEEGHTYIVVNNPDQLAQWIRENN